jgi:YbbR domain-containing protein
MKNLFQNIWIKLVAVALGLLLWFHVATNKTYTQRMTLPVAGIDVKEGLALATAPPDSLEVAVTATGKRLLLGVVRTEQLRINLTSLKPGTHQVDLTPSNVSFQIGNELLFLAAVLHPMAFTAEIDLMTSAKLEITPDIKITPADGFALASNPVCDPDRILVRGPKSAIEMLKRVSTMYQELNGLKNPTNFFAHVRQPGVAGVSAEPESVKVIVDIVAVKTRLFEKIPVVVFHTPSSENIKVVPSTVNLELTGPPDQIDLLNRNTLVASIDYRRLTRSGYGDITIDCPSGFGVKKSSADSALIVRGN